MWNGIGSALRSSLARRVRAHHRCCSGPPKFVIGNAYRERNLPLPDRVPCEDQVNGVDGIIISSNFHSHQGLQIVFLGTSSIPTAQRSMSCTLLKLGGSIFMVNCGEGSFRQLQRLPIRQQNVDNIFITQLLPDNILGLPSFLSGKAMQSSEFQRQFQVFGPPGLRRYIRKTLRACFGRVPLKYVVHELWPDKASHNRGKWSLDDEPHDDELLGNDIMRSEDGFWHVLKCSQYIVRGCLVSSKALSWGYVFQETPCTGSEQVNMEGKGQHKIVLTGHSKNPELLVELGQDADVIVHEAIMQESSPNIYLPAISAGEIANKMKAKCLILTRFHDPEEKGMKDFISAAESSFQKGAVICANDYMTITLL